MLVNFERYKLNNNDNHNNVVSFYEVVKMNFKNKLQRLFIVLLLFIIPLNAYAYSKHIIVGGETVGIEVDSKGVLIVGFYKVKDAYIAKDAGFEIGDKILKLNGEDIDSISSMIKIINESSTDTVEFTILRNNKEQNITLNLIEDEDGVVKSGIYIKDKVTGIGTLTYIDPNSKIFGALGHEIDEKTTASKFEIKGGIIFGASVVGIEKSSDGTAGEKNARYDKTKVFGTVKENEISGIFGSYTSAFDESNLLEVAEEDEVKLGNAKIKTVIDGTSIEEFDINIIKIDKNNETKNILFEIKDKKLLEKTGGIVQGMSGSPIIQNNKIIGAVTHVIVNDTTKGYGIFITTMLKEGEN